MPDLFTSPTGSWTGVSPALIGARRTVALICAALVIAVGAAVTAGLALAGVSWWVWIAAGCAGATLAMLAWVWWWTPRNWASWGYAEGEEDFTVRGGRFFRRLVTVPYGRMQFVDVEVGPIARRFGIATVTLHTASVDTAAEVPGLTQQEAHRLRDRLTELGDAGGAGV